MQGFRTDTIRQTETAAQSVGRSARVLHVTERGDGTATVTGIREVFANVDAAYAAALASIYCSSSSYYLAELHVERAQ